MRALAQCENAVTLREPVRSPGAAAKMLVGSKFPLSAYVPPNQLQIMHRVGPCSAGRPFIYFLVFNDIAYDQTEAAKRKVHGPHYSFRGPFFAVWIGWFGPKFVTILAAGVRVCSI